LKRPDAGENMKRFFALGLVIFPFLAMGFSCVGGSPGKGLGMRDGYYTAETRGFDSYGWKEVVSIYVNSNKIVTVEYKAENVSGFIKSWDMDYMRGMNVVSGTYPNKYSRIYAAGLLETQNPAKVDAVTGATESFLIFRLLAEAAIARARAGDKEVALVDIPGTS
jgi:major membrane immunogen (membrane-anchored lipoprotein)